MPRIKATLKRIVPEPALGLAQELLNHVVPERRRVLALTEKRRGRAQQRRILREYRKQYGGIVGSGPFAGMTLPDRHSWGAGLAAPLIGCYEEELHPFIEEVITSAPIRVVDVGCAEGYYTTGLALRMPETKVFGFDIDPSARSVAREAASLNGVADTVTIHGQCTTDLLEEIVDKRTFVLVDCEGAEMELLDPLAAPSLLNATILVECHDFIDPSITEVMTERFETSHRIHTIVSTPRDPSRYAFVRSLSTKDQAAAVDEYRPTLPHPMQWLFMRPLDEH